MQLSFDQYCSYCGRDLERKVRQSTADPRKDFILLRCPKRRWWNTLHAEVVAAYVTSETVLNYDPITGERIKRVKS